MGRTDDPRWHVRWSWRLLVILASYAVIAGAVAIFVWSLSSK